MKKEYTTEFSKLYRRILNIELDIKTNLNKSLIKTFEEKAFFRLIPYLEQLISTQKYEYLKNKNGQVYKNDYLKDIIKSNASFEQKLNQTFKRLYLKDFLGILTDYKLIYKNPMFKKHFYGGKIIDFNLLKKYSANLAKLRNLIMHFNFSDYQKEKIIFLESLKFWETLLNQDNAFIHTLPKVKPTIKNILKVIKNDALDIYFGYDRTLCDIFDDIAILNNLPTKNLPQYWSILRQKYILSKTKEQKYNEAIQQSLFSNDEF